MYSKFMGLLIIWQRQENEAPTHVEESNNARAQAHRRTEAHNNYVAERACSRVLVAHHVAKKSDCKSLKKSKPKSVGHTRAKSRAIKPLCSANFKPFCKLVMARPVRSV